MNENRHLIIEGEVDHDNLLRYSCLLLVYIFHIIKQS
jgi:hypothetical protein